jgi:integrase
MKKTPSIKTASAEFVTVLDLANLFLDELHRRGMASQVSWSHFRCTQNRLKRLCEYFGRRQPLSEIGKEHLVRAVMHFASRPASQDRPYQRQPKGSPISIASAKGVISQLKALFAWAADHDQLQWERPRGFERIFKLKRNGLLTAAERQQEAKELVTGEVRVFSPEELGHIYHSATSRERVFMLLGLNCGFTSGEISSLRRFEVFLDDPTPYIHKRRSKTGVEARWTLWPETAALLRKHRAKANEELRWLLTLADGPLVEVTEYCRRDSIDKHWVSLLKRAEIEQRLGFRFLRKTGANAIKRLGGLEESEMYLAHQEPGLNKHYANRNWDRMWACLEEFRSELPFLGSAWTLEPEECLFTCDLGVPWGDIEPPHSQRVSKRSDLRKLNVSFHTIKQKFYARVYRKGKTHFDGYFQTVEEAEEAAKRLRLKLDGIRPDQPNSDDFTCSRRKL